MLSTDAILAGLGLVIVLAIACQLLAESFRIPAIVLLLPVGFVAGAITEDVRPEALLGDAFQPIVSLGVGLILFEAGLTLRLTDLGPSIRRVVVRLISLGTLVTFAAVTLAVKAIFGLGWGTSSVLGAVLVVSGPTVVLPLLSFVRPSDTVRSVLKWEGTLIDPIGALFGVVVLDAVLEGVSGERPFHFGLLLSTLGIGIGVGLVAAGLLWLVLRQVERSAPAQAVAAALMAVSAAVVGADLLRDDAGLAAATAMGIVFATQDRIDLSRILDFHGKIVGLLIGVLFVMISASVTPAAVGDVVWRGLALVAVMVLAIRPLVVALGTWGSALSWRERAFAAWMAPRGIVAAATASAFAISLTGAGVADAEQILPIAFVVVFATVVLYGLTAGPVARLLEVEGAGSPVVLIVGGQAWARAIAVALANAGVRVRIWSGKRAEREAAAAAGLEASPTPLGVDVEEIEAELEEVSDALVMTKSDDFNALAAFELRQQLGRARVFRLAPREPPRAAPAHAEGKIMFSPELTYPILSEQIEAGACIAEVGASRDNGSTPMFAIGADGALRVLTAEDPLEADGDRHLIGLTTAS